MMVNYVPRLAINDPNWGNLNNIRWYTQNANNPYAETAYGYPVPNCTWYALGRWNELANSIINPPQENTLLYNAWEWIDRARGYDPITQTQFSTPIFQTGTTPQVGAIACWYDNNLMETGGGHVAVVEEIYSDFVVTSNSAYGGSLFFTQQNSTAAGGCDMAGFTFRGFIYHPGWVPPITKKSGMPVWMMIRHY